MRATNVKRGRTIKTVTLVGTARFTDDEVAREAMLAARENKSSLFGWNITRFSDPEVMDTASVDLYTD